MKKTLVVAAVTVLLIEVLAFVMAFNSAGFDKAGFGIANAIFTILSFFIGLISVAVKKTSAIGKGILIASGVLLIIGISICSSNGIG